jgi:hypothetical protein
MYPDPVHPSCASFIHRSRPDRCDQGRRIVAPVGLIEQGRALED